MMARIRDQMGKLGELKAMGDCVVSAMPVPLPADPKTLQMQVADVADRVTEMIREAIAPQQASMKQAAS
jgi:hypothetical protein